MISAKTSTAANSDMLTLPAPIGTSGAHFFLVMRFAVASVLVVAATAFTAPGYSSVSSETQLYGLFDNWGAGGSGKDRLDEEWEAQQEILKLRRGTTDEKKAYFQKVEDRRRKATKDQKDMWAWQTKTYGKGEDPINEWRKRRADGRISDLDNQYGDPEKVGGIPIPGASFGVGGEFGVGGKFDNGGRFDLRLPYAEQGYVDEDADVMGKLGNMFGFGKKKEAPPKEEPKAAPSKKSWPW